MRGIRIELEALEAAIMDLGTVKHCDSLSQMIFKLWQ